jgi:hypothetical protein
MQYHSKAVIIGQSSGAYIFRSSSPKEKPEIINEKPKTIFLEGDLFVEVLQEYSNYAKQKIRLYNTINLQDIIEMELEIGTLPENRELVIRFNTSINNNKIINHDLNAWKIKSREILVNTTEYVASNFYPTQYLSFIEDSNKRFSMISDYSHSVASLENGQIEAMLHRRFFF